MRVFIGMETSGALRRRFKEAGHDVCSCDLLPAQDGDIDDHVEGDVFQVLNNLERARWKPDLAIFHPPCTYLTSSAEWAYKDPDYDRYPRVGYHQKPKPETLTGTARRAARDDAIRLVNKIWSLRIERMVIENPIGALSRRWKLPCQIIQPYQFGDDASKATCLWIRGLPLLVSTHRVHGRVVYKNGKPVERWSNQTDGGQNKLPPSEDRWKVRSDTFPGIADAMVQQWGNPERGMFAA